MCIFLTKARIKQHFYHFCAYPCKRISISPDMTIIARCDQCAKTGCVARDCLCVYAYAKMALAIMPTSHAEVIIKSHCYVIMTAQFFAPNWYLRGLDRTITQVINEFFCLTNFETIRIYQVWFLFGMIPGVNSYSCHFGTINK